MSNNPWWISTLIIGMLSCVCTSIEARTQHDPTPPAGREFAMADAVDYPQLLDAVKAAGRQYLHNSVVNDREYFGGVVRTSRGRYRLHSAAGARRVDRFRFRLAVPSGDQLVAIWHTHGAPGARRDYFSPEDVSTVEQLQYPMFLITPQGQINVLLPEKIADQSASATTLSEQAFWSALLHAPIDFTPRWRRAQRGRWQAGAKKGIAVGRISRLHVTATSIPRHTEQ